MNELIRELAEMATIRGEEYLPGNDGHPTPTFYFDKEKFAELIILECCDWIDGSSTLPTKSIITDNIKARFGVKG